MCASLSGCFAGPPQIISLTPSRGSVGVPADTPITVQFDRPVVRSSVADRFSIAPSITGCDLAGAFTDPQALPCGVVWADADAAFTLLHPVAVLAPDLQYTFTLRGGFRDPAGSVNTVDHVWQITTAGAPQVRATSPSNGATAVPVDGPLTVDFNSGMNLASTDQAIALDPAVPGTQVIRNAKDKSRFILVPGQLLQPGATYRLSVAATATDIHGQRLFAPVTVSFSTRGVSPGSHGVVLARRGSEGPTEVLVTALGPIEDGMPVASQAALIAPTCQAPGGCGAAPVGAALYAYVAAVLSPDDRWLAVVEQDHTAPSLPPTLLVLDAASRAMRAALPGGTLPSWSPDSTTLAYADGASVRLYHPAAGTTATLPSGDPIVAPPAWGPGSELLALDEAGPGGEHVDLADAIAGARYAVPGLSGEATAPTIAPDGSSLAVYRLGPAATGTWLIGLASGVGPPRALDASLIPVGFADSGTLVARSAPAQGPLTLTRISIAGGAEIPSPIAVKRALPAGPIAVAPGGRQIAYLAAPTGTTNGFVENADGSGAQALTTFAAGTLEAAGITLS